MENMASSADKETMVASFLEVAVDRTADIAHHFLEQTGGLRMQCNYFMWEIKGGLILLHPIFLWFSTLHLWVIVIAEYIRNVTQLVTGTTTLIVGASLPSAESYSSDLRRASYKLLKDLNEANICLKAQCSTKVDGPELYDSPQFIYVF